MASRKPASTTLTRESAEAVIVAHVLTLDRQASIADALGVNPKTLRQRTRSGGYKDAEGNALPPVKVNTDGTAALTDAHKEAIARAYMPQDDAAVIALAESFTK